MQTITVVLTMSSQELPSLLNRVNESCLEAGLKKNFKKTTAMPIGKQAVNTIGDKRITGCRRTTWLKNLLD